MFERLIAERAQATPNAPALIADLNAVSFQTMERDVRKAAAWLATRRMKPQERVILQLASPYLQWVLFYAMEAHGLIPIPMMMQYPLTPEGMAFLGASVVVSDAANPGFEGVTWIPARTLLPATIAKFRPIPLPRRERRGDDPVIIVLSTGTTGMTKKVLLDRAMLDRRIVHALSAKWVEPRMAVLSELPFQSIGGLYGVTMAWKSGGTMVYRSPAMAMADVIRKLPRVTLVGAPIHLTNILESLPEDFVPPGEFTVVTGGGSLSKPLAAEIARRLSPDIRTGYGNTEAGVITHAPLDEMRGAEDLTGYVMPWMEVSLIDADGNATPPGETGEIRVRGEDAVTEYLDDPFSTAKYFRDGWYHPGDLGHFDESGRLTVTGRLDDLMSFGGFKVLPVNVETDALKLGGIDDIAAFGASDPATGTFELWVAYVADGPVDPVALGAFLRNYPKPRLARVGQIRRNPMGKVERAAMRTMVERGDAAML